MSDFWLEPVHRRLLLLSLRFRALVGRSHQNMAHLSDSGIGAAPGRPFLVPLGTGKRPVAHKQRKN